MIYSDRFVIKTCTQRWIAVMKVLVVGQGGREHALAWKLAHSESVSEVFCVPGNAGIAADADCVDLDVGDIPALVTSPNPLPSISR